MAEVLAIVASGVSIAQIAVELLSCILKLRTLCRALRDIPGEFEGTLDELEVLGKIFYQLGAFETDNSQPGHSALQAGLTQCRKTATKLQALATAGSRPQERNKSQILSRVKAVMRIKEVKDLKTELDAAKAQLEAAKLSLQLAMTCYSLNMQRRHITLLEVHNLGLSKPCSDRSDDLQAGHSLTIIRQEDSRMIQFELSRRQSSLQRSKCSIGKCYCSCHNSSTRSARLWSLKVPRDWNSCDKTTCNNYKRASFWISLTTIGIPLVVRASLDIMWTIHQSHIYPSLHFTRVVDWDAPAFALLRDIRWNQMTFEEARLEIMRLFDSGVASPLDILPNGESLPEKLLTLPWPNGDTQLKVLELLVRAGSLLNTIRILKCCSGWKGLGRWKTGLDNNNGAHTHLMNRLLHLGLDPSEIDVPEVEFPTEFSPMPASKWGLHGDPFFVNWISEGLKVSPGFAGSSPLQEAILVGSSETVKIILENSQVTEDENILRQSPLHLAVWRPQHLALLLQAGFDVNAWDWNGRTPLMYAAATGMTEVAITLIQAGADIWVKDNLYSKHTWLPYAIVSTHWQLVLGVIDVVRQLPRFSKDSVQVLLDSAIGWWAMDILAPKDSTYFATLLEWGADPGFRLTVKLPGYKVPDCTLLHCITNSRDFDTLLRSGFKSFNHANGKGGHALMTQLEVGNPELIQKSITAGCHVDHQDFKGRTALHICAEIIRATILSNDLRDRNLRFQILGCTEALLLNGADPFLGDCCHCACSESGCTPAQILLKDFHHKRGDTAHRSYPLTMHFWVNQWLQLLKGAETDFEYSRRFFHDAIRLSKFEQLELTHTCCRFVSHGDRLWINMDEEDEEEIRDEERELIDLLESGMSAAQSCSISELESLWQKEMDKLMELQGSNFVCAGNP